jgi:aryl-alcohol dehydrogenase-like predicted oxidoreductase
MERRTLGATGISVSTLALGTMMFGSFGNADHDDSVRIIRRAIDGGINFLDTANVYSGGESEQIVGTAIAGRRDEIVLATKFAMPMGEDPNDAGGSRRHIMRAVEDSLRRLGTDHVDLYQMHRPDYTTDLDETLAALSDLVQQGKVRAIGHSTYPAERIVEAQWVAAEHGHRRFLTEQPRYSIFNRAIERAVLPTTQRYGMGVLTYGPLNSGWLSGRPDPTSAHRVGSAPQVFDQADPGNRAKLAAVGALRPVADQAGLTLAHLATAFPIAHPAVTSVIIGPRTMQHLESTLAGADVRLAEDLLDRIDEIVAPGTELNAVDMYRADPPAMLDKRLRRR